MKRCSLCLRRLTSILLKTHEASSTNGSNIRTFSAQAQTDNLQVKQKAGEPVPDWSYLLNPENAQSIQNNIIQRKGVGDISRVLDLYNEYKRSGDETVRDQLLREALLIPNKCSPDTPPNTDGEVHVVRMLHSKKDKTEHRRHKYSPFMRLMQTSGLLGSKTGNNDVFGRQVYGDRSYALFKDLAKLERVLVSWTISKLQERGWSYITVPDLIPEHVINACGFITTGKQNQIYKISREQGDLCLSGTSEMAMAGLYANSSMPSEQPVKICTFSPCYRAEEARNAVDRNFYRLHQFTKVEMFGVCNPEDSDALYNEVVETQQSLFSELNLTCRVLSMPSNELGASAYAKTDVEAWMPGKEHWGEISSASNCTDYQARRLNITTTDRTRFAHTVNGTACAIPRMLISIVEQNQHANKLIRLPTCLVPYMNSSVLNTKTETPLHVVRRRYKKPPRTF